MAVVRLDGRDATVAGGVGRRRLDVAPGPRGLPGGRRDHAGGARRLGREQRVRPGGGDARGGGRGISRRFATIPYRGGAKDPPSSTLVAAVVRERAASRSAGSATAAPTSLCQSGTWQLSRYDTWVADQVAQGLLSDAEAATDPNGPRADPVAGLRTGATARRRRCSASGSRRPATSCSAPTGSGLPPAATDLGARSRSSTTLTPLGLAAHLTELARQAGAARQHHGSPSLPSTPLSEEGDEAVADARSAGLPEPLSAQGGHARSTPIISVTAGSTHSVHVTDEMMEVFLLGLLGLHDGPAEQARGRRTRRRPRRSTGCATAPLRRGRRPPDRPRRLPAAALGRAPGPSR